MKTMVAGVLCLLLAGCATERYYPVNLAGGDGYYVAEREYGSVDPGTRYDSLFAVGVYPWWVHTFYSPYFYPYYFTYYHPYYYPYYGPYHLAGWYPAWSYDPGYESRYGSGWPPYWPHRNVPPGPGQSMDDPPPGETGHNQPGGPIHQPVAGEPGQRGSGANAFARRPAYRGPAPQRPAYLSAGPQRVTAPLDTAIRARALTPGISPDTFVPGGLAPGGRVSAARRGLFRAVRGGGDWRAVARSASRWHRSASRWRPGSVRAAVLGEPGRSHVAPPERGRIERDRAERVE
jgi:hypothetical protein